MGTSKQTGFPNRISLDIELLSSDEYPNSAFMQFDFDFMAVFGSKGRIPVILTVGEYKYRSTIAVYNGVHMMVFNKQMRLDTGYGAGDMVHITLERDSSKREVEIPEDVNLAIKEAGVRESFMKLSYSHRKENMDWINDAKKPETRLRRINKLIDTLTQQD